MAAISRTVNFLLRGVIIADTLEEAGHMSLALSMCFVLLLVISLMK